MANYWIWMRIYWIEWQFIEYECKIIEYKWLIIEYEWRFVEYEWRFYWIWMVIYWIQMTAIEYIWKNYWILLHSGNNTCLVCIKLIPRTYLWNTQRHLICNNFLHSQCGTTEIPAGEIKNCIPGTRRKVSWTEKDTKTILPWFCPSY